jgi:putative aminopeptidase FrvX
MAAGKPPELKPELELAARRILTVPTAPYFERQTREAVRTLLLEAPGIKVRQDTFGNLLAHYCRSPRPGTSVAFVAHLDHPGFVVPSRRKSLAAARFLGGVKEACFQGQKVEFFVSEHANPVGTAMVRETRWGGDIKAVEFDRPVPADARFGMWSLPALRIAGDRVSSRACDDLVGCASIVALLRSLAFERARADVWALFTRAEEIGFLGALASLDARPRLPAGTPVISIETSQARGFAAIGDGPVLRVGDRTALFSPDITDALRTCLDGRGLKYQRLLMAGGTCEATPFVQAGFPTGALCLPLHNYHNMSVRGAIEAEAVSVSDWNGLLDALLAIARDIRWEKRETGLTTRLESLRRKALATLPRTGDAAPV